MNMTKNQPLYIDIYLLFR